MLGPDPSQTLNYSLQLRSVKFSASGVRQAPRAKISNTQDCVYYVYTNIHIYIYTYHCFVQSIVFRQCQWDRSCRSRRELSNAIVKSDFGLTDVEIWPFPFRNGPSSVTSLLLIWLINVTKQFQLQHYFNISLLMLFKEYHYTDLAVRGVYFLLIIKMWVPNPPFWVQTHPKRLIMVYRWGLSNSQPLA